MPRDLQQELRSLKTLCARAIENDDFAQVNLLSQQIVAVKKLIEDVNKPFNPFNKPKVQTATASFKRREPKPKPNRRAPKVAHKIAIHTKRLQTVKAKIERDYQQELKELYIEEKQTKFDFSSYTPEEIKANYIKLRDYTTPA